MEKTGYEKWKSLSRPKGIRRLLRNWKNIYFLLKSGEFDDDWYVSKYPEVNGHDIKKGIVHYVVEGAYKGYSPNAYFDAEFYMNQNLDLCEDASLNPFVHYLRCGRQEGRVCAKPSPLTDIWTHDYEGNQETVGVSIVTSSKVRIPLQESDYDKYDIEVIESVGDYGETMEKCHKEVVWFLEENYNIERFCRILAGRKYFLDPSVFSVSSQGQNEFLVASDMIQVEGMFPVCIRFEMSTVLLRKTQCPVSRDTKDSFNTFAHDIMNGKKVVFTNASGRPLKEMDYEEFLSAYKNMRQGYHVNAEKVLELNSEIRKIAWSSNVSKEEWDSEEWLNKMIENIRIPHILISIYAFSYGGGEIMPIRLANILWEKGYQVGVHIYNSNEYDRNVRMSLNSSIPVIYADSISEMVTQIDKLGYNVIHTHHQACQTFVNQVLVSHENLQKRVCHIATSHGIYDEIEKDILKAILEQDDMANRVSYWTYVADKSIIPFQKVNVYEKERFVKIPNGMQMPEISPFDLSEYGITKDDFVITIISRALFEKGWLHAIHAVEKLHDSHPEIHLLLVGNGEVYDKCKEQLENEYIHFLGFRENPCDIFSVSKLCLLPSHSDCAPLCLIEAMMCSIPAIATDTGDIREMLTYGDSVAGKVISLKNKQVDENELADAIREMIENKEVYEKAVQTAKHKSRTYQIDAVSEQYVKVYLQGLAKTSVSTEEFEQEVKKEREKERMLWNAGNAK